MSRRHRASALLAIAALALAGCGTPPWEEAALAAEGEGGAAAPATAEPSTEPSATGATAEPTVEDAPAPLPTAAAPIAPLPNDLGSGSTRRELTAGTLGVTVDYWSDLAVGDWTSNANKPVSLSVTTYPELYGTDVYLSRLSVTTSVTDADGTPLPSPPAYEDRASVHPGYVTGDPYSYATTFVLPPLDPAATQVVLTLSYDLLVSTGYSEEYMKQTAVDTLRVAVVPHAPATAPAPATSERAGTETAALDVA
ncbi:hypothetical protein [Georgenia wangjunii]|uniref:hypothetical protein n=1 Tax=Georgenia wangjunii TaxID=3117730 RepID=UPI002F26044B